MAPVGVVFLAPVSASPAWSWVCFLPLVAVKVRAALQAFSVALLSPPLAGLLIPPISLILAVLGKLIWFKEWFVLKCFLFFQC